MAHAALFFGAHPRAGAVIELAEAVGIGGVAADSAAPDDPLYAQQYGLENIGQSLNGVAGAPGADVNARGAWHLSTGGAGTIVAVLDAGVDADAAVDADAGAPSTDASAAPKN